jgi:hypothetical protein
MEISPSFYKIIRDNRRNDKVSDDQFIASLLNAIARGDVDRLPCGHGIHHLDNDECLICKTKNQTREV